jgi:hypothetical protein
LAAVLWVLDAPGSMPHADQENEVGHALSIAEKGIDEEGRNLIGGKDTP